MKTIKTLQDIEILKQVQGLSGDYMEFLEEQLKKLTQALREGQELEQSSLEEWGYMVVLEPGDNVRDLIMGNIFDYGSIKIFKIYSVFTKEKIPYQIGQGYLMGVYMFY